MTDNTNIQPWDRQPGELNLGFSRFERYRLMGPKRSVLAILHEDQARQPGHGVLSKRPPGKWIETSVTWKWRERAEAWDAFERARVRAEYEKERRDDRTTRIAVLKNLRMRLIEGLNKLTPDQFTATIIISGLRSVMQELRAEYDQEPKQRHVFGIEELKAETDLVAHRLGIDPILLLEAAKGLSEEES